MQFLSKLDVVECIFLDNVSIEIFIIEFGSTNNIQHSDNKKTCIKERRKSSYSNIFLHVLAALALGSSLSTNTFV